MIDDRESRRLAALSAYGIMDSAPDPAFDEIAQLAAAICQTPIGVVNFIDEQRQFFKAEVGLGVRSTPLETSFCAKALLEEDFLMVPDATQDPRFDCNPLVTGAPHLRFYAGALLKTPDGLPIGTLCVLDYKARTLDDHQHQSLRVLARQVMAQLNLQMAGAERVREASEARTNEERLSLILDSATDYAILTVDAHGIIDSWSAGAQAAFEWTADEAIGCPFDILFTPEDRDNGQPAIELALADREGCAPDVRWHQRSDGTRVFMNGSTHPLPVDAAGRPRGYLKIARNETAARSQNDELARTRLELVDSEARFRNMADHSPVMMWVTDPSGYCTYLNRSWYEFTGQTEEEAHGYGWLEVTHPHDKARAERAFVEANAERAPFRVEYRLRRADGTYRWAIDAASPRFGENGEYLGYVGSVVDIEEQRETEARIRESEEQLRLATDAADIGFWDVDLIDDKLIWPARVKSMFGISPSVPVTMQDFYDGLHPEDREHTSAAFAAASDPERRALYDVEYRTIGKKDGIIRWVQAKGRGLFTDTGECFRVVGAAIDISQRKSIEDQLHQLNETLEQRVEEEIAERTKAEEALRQSQKMEAVGQLTGGIAHDFNNMLTGVLAGVDLARRSIARGQMERVDYFLDAAATSAHRAAALTARLLAFGRRQSLDLKPTDVNQLVTGLEDMLHRTLGEQVALKTHLAPDLWTASTDPSQLENALLNMCLNARDAMPNGGKLTIESANTTLDERYAARHPGVTAGEYVVVCVSDTGTGMSAATIEKAFDPFFTTKPIGQGTGLGLSMIYGFAKQSGGHVRIYSEVGEGTTVTLFLPRERNGSISQAEPTKTQAAPTGDGEIVLVVEDDPGVRMLVLEVLDELGYKAIAAANADEALPVLQSSDRIDLLITDVGLPGMNGRQLAEVARTAREGLRILFITGYAENAAVRSGFLEAGMEMMTKPFALDALAAKIRSILASPEST